MTRDEALKAFNEGTPVICKDIEYKYINAISWRVVRDKDGKITDRFIQAEMQDEKANSVTTSRIEWVQPAY